MSSPPSLPVSGVFSCQPHGRNEIHVATHTDRVPAGKHVLRILNNEGDRTITYDPTVEAERITAEAALEESVAKGGTAFVLETESGGQGYVTRTLEQEGRAHRGRASVRRRVM